MPKPGRQKYSLLVSIFLSLFDIQAEGLRYISQRQIKQMMTMMIGLVEAGGVLSGKSDSCMMLWIP